MCVLLCNSSSVWLIPMSIPGKKMTKDFSWLDPFKAQTISRNCSRVGGMCFSVLRNHGFTVGNLGASSTISKSATVWTLLSLWIEGWKITFFFLPWGCNKETSECHKGFDRYSVWMQPHILLKRLTVYLSAILKILFENKVFDTIIPLL